MNSEDFQADVRQERHDDERREQSMYDLVDQLEAKIRHLMREHVAVKAARYLVPGEADFQYAWGRVADAHDDAELAQ